MIIKIIVVVMLLSSVASAKKTYARAEFDGMEPTAIQKKNCVDRQVVIIKEIESEIDSGELFVPAKNVYINLSLEEVRPISNHYNPFETSIIHPKAKPISKMYALKQMESDGYPCWGEGLSIEVHINLNWDNDNNTCEVFSKQYLSDAVSHPRATSCPGSKD